MIDFRSLPRFFWRLMKFNRVWYSLGLGPIVGRLILLLATTGRTSGRSHVIPLQYEEEDGMIYVAAARGPKADWFLNIIANPNVEVQVRARHFHGLAEPIIDPVRIADFLELRLRLHPRMVGMMLRSEGLPTHPNRAQLEQYAAKIALVAIRPCEDEF
jgi:deazaflavin-dependent oxidoreductase (nitroreductase family)